MKTWLKGGLYGAIIFLVFAISSWLYISSIHNCLLNPTQSLNVGGPDCYFSFGRQSLGRHSIWGGLLDSLFYFSIFIIPGFIIGSIIGLIIQKFKLK